MVASNKAADSGLVKDGFTSVNSRLGAIKQQDILTERGALILAIPSYFWPDDTYTTGDKRWRRATSSGARLMVANPNSGPGTSADANFTRAIDECHARGTQVIGYVRTNYAQNTSASIKADIDLWYSNYPKIDGIFFDEVDNGQNQYVADAHAFYADLVSYVRAKNDRYITAVNPGTDFVTTAMLDVADISMTFEHDAATYLAKASVADAVRSGKTKHWHCVYNVATDQVSGVIAKARELGATHLYMTDDVMPNPYDSLAPQSYLDRVVGRSNFTLPTASAGQVLTFNGSAWIAQTPVNTGTDTYSSTYSTSFDTTDSWTLTTNASISGGNLTITGEGNGEHGYRDLSGMVAAGDRVRVTITVASGSTGTFIPMLDCIDSGWTTWYDLPDVSPSDMTPQSTTTAYTFTVPAGTAHTTWGVKSNSGTVVISDFTVERLTSTGSGGGGSTATTSDINAAYTP